jgi:hypothetical protein
MEKPMVALHPYKYTHPLLFQSFLQKGAVANHFHGFATAPLSYRKKHIKIITTD